MWVLIVVLVCGAVVLYQFTAAMNKPLAATREEALARGWQLLEALKKPDLNLAWALCQVSPDLGLKDEEGQTALHLAVKCRDRQLVGRLAALGADPDAADGQGKTPRMLAGEAGLEGLFRAGKK